MLYNNDNDCLFFLIRFKRNSVCPKKTVNLSVTQHESSSSFCITRRKLAISIGNDYYFNISAIFLYLNTFCETKIWLRIAVVFKKT